MACRPVLGGPRPHYGWPGWAWAFLLVRPRCPFLRLVIADAVLPRDERMFCRTILVTSPKLDKYKRRLKQGFQPRCMPLWDLEEIKAVHTEVYSDKAWEDVEKSFEMWGGVPRTVLQLVDDCNWQMVLQSSLNIDRITQCMKFDGHQSYSTIDEVTALVHLVPMDDKYIQTHVQSTSRELCNIVLDLLIEGDVQHATNTLLATKGIGVYGSLRGSLFENLAHDIISGGGEFPVRDLEKKFYVTTAISKAYTQGF